jgi:tetratricopeptide (TPR) repeat protein
MPLSEYAILLGDVYAEMGERQKAAEQYDLVRAIDKLFRANGVNTDLEIALFYADHDLELQTSLEKARSAYKARPSIEAADTLAWTLYKTGDYREAQQYASEALKLGTRDPLKLFHAGMISKALGQKEQAQEYLQQAVDLNPHFSLLYGDDAIAELKALKAGGDN